MHIFLNGGGLNPPNPPLATPLVRCIRITGWQCLIQHSALLRPSDAYRRHRLCVKHQTPAPGLSVHQRYRLRRLARLTLASGTLAHRPSATPTHAGARRRLAVTMATGPQPPQLEWCAPETRYSILILLLQSLQNHILCVEKWDFSHTPCVYNSTVEVDLYLRWLACFIYSFHMYTFA